VRPCSMIRSVPLAVKMTFLAKISVKIYLPNTSPRDSVGVVRYADLGIIPLAYGVGDTVAFLSVYLDESYRVGSPRLFVSGFVSEIDRWAHFATAWQRDIVEAFHVPYIHMKTLYKSVSHGLYKDLTTSEKAAMFAAAVSLIREHADFGVSCSVNMGEYLSITTRDERSWYGTAYTVGVMGCLSAIKDKLGQKMPDTTLSVYLEDGHRNTDQAIEILIERRRFQEGVSLSALSPDTVIMELPVEDCEDEPQLRLGTVAPQSKAQMSPLQAADILAYGMLNVSHPLFRLVLSQINESTPIYDYYLTAESIRTAIDKRKAKDLNARESWNKVARVLGTGWR